MVSARRAMRPIVAIYPPDVNHERFVAWRTAIPRDAYSGRLEPTTYARSAPRLPVTERTGRRNERAELEWKAQGRGSARDQVAEDQHLPGEARQAPTHAQAEGAARREVGLAGCRRGPARARRGVRGPLPVDRHPGPQRGLPDRDLVHLLRRRRPTELGKFATQNRDSIPLDEMPQHLQDAVVAAENRTFWTDSGIDPRGIVRAAFSNASGNSHQGASTITQQYVKILYLTSERSYTRKVKEAVLSLKLQRQQSKQEILEGYLNTIYFGRGAYGVQAAAQAYFDKPAAKLSLRESAVLARVLNNPSRYDPAKGEDARRSLKAGYERRPRRHGRDGRDRARGGREGREEAAEVPEGGGREHVRRPARPHALDGQEGAPAPRLHRGGDRRPGPAGHHHPPAAGDARRPRRR